ncbi:hypothetical protein L6E12_30605 [Actinokineospora sp. PR83]|uniref:hypothetical protein n=1 Tax=Actinokineospora sp. PR83 TaxID=2884908 RepID=UPI001F213EA2|nr:hypothetical protein [Actinokineospora sp. PR83]MCG8920131.1 hypothetical protein [Actinokineospora sp. PR83]
MDTEDLTTALRAATDDVRPRPGFTDDVLRGAHRARTRHRRTLASGTAVLVVALTAGAVAWSTGGRPEQAPAQPPVATSAPVTFDGPTRGDLAGDQAYLAKVLAAWRQALPASPNKEAMGALAGEARVYWAGTTAAGRVALVRQPGDDPTATPALGLLLGDAPTVIQDVPPGGLARGEGVGFTFGEDERHALAVTAPGSPVFISPGFVVGQDGRGAREWTRMDDRDGVALTTLPSAPGSLNVRLAGTPGPDQLITVLSTHANRTGFQAQKEHLIGRAAVARRGDGPPVRVAGTPTPLLDTRDLGALEAAGISDPLAYSTWLRAQSVADLADGRTLRGFALQQDGRPERYYTMIVDRAGRVEWLEHFDNPQELWDTSPLLANTVLPDGLGRLVVQPGAHLRYRTATGTWVDAGQGGAILPSTAAGVEVGYDGGGLPQFTSF